MTLILVTGSREWNDSYAVDRALMFALNELPVTGPLALVHGDAKGLDRIAESVWNGIRNENIKLFGSSRLIDPIRYPAHLFATPKIRNQYMVNQGADICLAFAKEWASGTGNCARLARKAGIDTHDFGVNTE